MARIEYLTLEEEALLPVVREEWRKISLATGPTDRKSAQAAVANVYRLCGLEPPERWVWFGSPWAGCIGTWMLMQSPHIKKSVRAEVGQKLYQQAWDQIQRQVSDRVRYQIGAQVSFEAGYLIAAEVDDKVQIPIGGQLWSEVWHQIQTDFWPQIPEQLRHEHDWGDVWEESQQFCFGQGGAALIAAFDMYRRIERFKGAEWLEPMVRLETVAGWWWPFAEVCIMSDRPIVLHCDQGGLLHCGNGPALAYPDGSASYVWHGLPIPAWLVENRERLTPEIIEAETDAELRRVMLEIYGFDKYLEIRGARLIAEDECLGLPRQLFQIDLAGETIRVLRVVNGTVEPDGRRRQFHLGVPLECNTPQEAVAWSYGRPGHLHTEAVRT